MVRAFMRLIVVLIIIVAAAAFFLGWLGGGRAHPSDSLGTAGHIDTSKAERAGAKVGEKTAEAASRAAEILSDSALTAKIKSKMALDDTVRARAVDVSTTDHVVTLSGTVRSQAEHDRVVQLARETDGVTRVIDHLSR